MFASVEPMAKPSRERDFERAETKKARRFKKPNVETGKRTYNDDVARAEKAAKE